MELYNPPHVSLPALKINKIRDRQIMEDDLAVGSFIRTKLLLEAEFNRLYLGVLSKSKKLLQLINQPEQNLELELPFLGLKLHGTRPDFVYERIARDFLLHQGVRGRIPKKIRNQFEQGMREAVKKAQTNARAQLIRLSNQIQNQVSVFEHKSGQEMQILSSTTVHTCRGCAKILSKDKFKMTKCSCGQRIDSISQVRQVPLHHFNERLVRFLESNYWLEHGVDHLLRQKNFQTLVGYHVLGHSGVWHEIDIIADSKEENYRIFCECKNAEVKVNDIFVFFGKMSDAGCTRGYLFTTAAAPALEISRLGRSKNVTIIPDVLKRPNEEVIREIKEA